MSANKGNPPGAERNAPDCNRPGPSRELPPVPEREEAQRGQVQNDGQIEGGEIENQAVHPPPANNDDLEDSPFEMETLFSLDNLNMNIDSSESSIRTSSADSGRDSKRFEDTTDTSDSSFDADEGKRVDAFFKNAASSTPK